MSSCSVWSVHAFPVFPPELLGPPAALLETSSFSSRMHSLTFSFLCSLRRFILGMSLLQPLVDGCLSRVSSPLEKVKELLVSLPLRRYREDVNERSIGNTIQGDRSGNERSKKYYERCPLHSRRLKNCWCRYPYGDTEKKLINDRSIGNMIQGDRSGNERSKKYYKECPLHSRR